MSCKLLEEMERLQDDFRLPAVAAKAQIEALRTVGDAERRFEIRFDRTVPVGKFLPNLFGLNDLSGNVNEWCQDAFDSANAGNPKAGNRVMRGGSARDSVELLLRNSDRDSSAALTRYWAFGLRCVLEVGTEE